MKRLLFFTIYLFLLYNYVYAQNNDPFLKKGEMRLYFIPDLNLVINKPISGWNVRGSNLDKIFYKDEDSNSKFRITNGEYLFFDWWFLPVRRLKINVGYEMALDYADTYFHPINMEHKIKNEYFSSLTEEEREEGITFNKILKRIRFWKGKAEYRNNFLYARLYKGYGHSGWDYEGDIFGFFIEQWDIENYRRIGFDAAPTAFQLDWNLVFKGVKYGNLSVALGPEPIWGYGFSYYAKYTYKYRLWIPTLLFKSENIKWGREDTERIWALALTSKYYGVRSIPLEFGIIFQPFRVNEEYTITHKVDIEDGYGDSGYYIAQKKTDYLNAFGFKVKAETFRYVPFVDKTIVSYEFLGKIAGNKSEFDINFEKKFNNIYSLYLNNIIRFPVEGPEVLILEGDREHPGVPVTEPRGNDDPFWVNSKNREAYISSFTFIFDPTPGSWIFVYRPNILEEWNLNMYETSPFALLFNYKISYYPGTTDLEPYITSTGEWIWPGDYDPTASRGPVPPLAGCWPLKYPIHFFTLISEFKVANGKLMNVTKWGDKLASSSIAYTLSTYNLIPITRMFSSKFIFFKYPFYVSFEYGHNVWGEEFWFETLGGAIDNMYKFSIKYNLNKNNEFQLSYTGYRENDNKYFIDKLGVFDEFRLSYRGKFNTRFNLYYKNKNEEEIDNSSLHNIINKSNKGKANDEDTLDSILNSDNKTKEDTLDSILNSDNKRNDNINNKKNNNAKKNENKNNEKKDELDDILK